MFSQKQTAKASAEQNKTPKKKADPKSKKNNTREGGRRKKEEASQSRRSEDTKYGPSAAASEEVHPISEQEHKRSIECWYKVWEAEPQHKAEPTEVVEISGREGANLDAGVNRTCTDLCRYIGGVRSNHRLGSRCKG